MVDSPQFTQIPLNRDLLPLDDLHASGGYDRKLILPDDVPPVINQPWTQGPVKPRLLTGQDDGSANVFITGGQVAVSGGGGGGGGPYTQVVTVAGTAHLDSNQLARVETIGLGGNLGTLQGLSTLYGVQYAITVQAYTGGGEHYDLFSLQLYDQAEDNAFYLFTVPLANAPANFAPMPAIQSGFVSYGPGINLTTTFPGSTNYDLWRHGGAGWSLSYTVNFFAS